MEQPITTCCVCGKKATHFTSAKTQKGYCNKHWTGDAFLNFFTEMETLQKEGKL